MYTIQITILIPQAVLLTKALPGYRKGSENMGAGGSMWARLPTPLLTTHAHACTRVHTHTHIPSFWVLLPPPSLILRLQAFSSHIPPTPYPHHFLCGPPYLAPRQDDPSTFQMRKLDSLVAPTLQNLCLPTPYVSTLQASAPLCSRNTHFSVFIGSFCKHRRLIDSLSWLRNQGAPDHSQNPSLKHTTGWETRKDHSATGPEAPLTLKILLAAATASFLRYIPFLLLCMTCLRDEALGGCIRLAELCHVPALQPQRRLGKWGLGSRGGEGGTCLPGRLER